MPPEDVEIPNWTYELIQQTCSEINVLISLMMGICTQDTCPVMRYDEETEFLCANHATPNQCSALDYCAHTMSKINADLNSQNTFPMLRDFDPDVIAFFLTFTLEIFVTSIKFYSNYAQGQTKLQNILN